MITLPRETIEHAIRQHAGNRTRTRAMLGVSANTLRRLIAAESLGSLADSLAAEVARPGPRRLVDDETMQAERDRVLAALAAEPSVREAAGALGMPQATFYRRMRNYGITRAEIDAARQPSSTNPPEK
jgi:DNA-binding NtrC family response regulator